MNDAQIVTRLKNRDKTALSDLYDYYAAAFYGQALRILGTEAPVQEVVQNTFLKIWNNIDQYDDSKGRLFTWMFRIARNEAIDKKKSKQINYPDKTTLSDPSIFTEEAKIPLVNNIEDTGVKQLLNLLDEDTKSILELVYFQGHTHSEVAGYTKTPIGQVKARVRRAILKLRSVLIKE